MKNDQLYQIFKGELKQKGFPLLSTAGDTSF